MDGIKVSIIMPVYNVDKYIKKSLDSVINQTLREIEIICVNDGSTDNSPQILEEYAERDNRIKIINKKNGGISSARNKGIEQAKGEYIGFVDSDDWAELDMFEKLYKNAKTYDSDMVMCAAHRFDDINKQLNYDLPYFTMANFDKTYDNSVFNHNKTNDLLFVISVTPWNKIYKSTFIEAIGARFPEGLDFDDVIFFFKTYLKAEKVSLIRDLLYFYRINRAGSFITSANERYYDIVKVYDIIEDIILETGNQDKYMELFSNIRIPYTMARYNRVEERYKKDFFDIIKNNFKKMNPICINHLNSDNKEEYQKIIDSDNHREYKLIKKIHHLKEEIFQLKQGIDQEISCKSKIESLKNEYKTEINNKNMIIQEITSSNSWKLTKPLRRIGNLLRRNY